MIKILAILLLCSVGASAQTTPMTATVGIPDAKNAEVRSLLQDWVATQTQTVVDPETGEVVT